MNCPHADHLIQTALDGRLSPAERARLDGHLSGCTGCRAAWDEYRRLGKTATDWARRPILADDPGDVFTAQVMAQIAREAALSPRHPLRRLHAWGLTGFCVGFSLLSYWAGPLLMAHVSHVPLPTLPSPWAAFSLNGVGQTLGAALQDTLGMWRTLAARPIALPGWTPGALLITLALNGAFIRHARRQTRRTAAR